MGVYLRGKIEVSFKEERGNFTPPQPPQNEPLKSSPRLGLRLLSSPFLVHYQHLFVYCDAFVFKISFLICLLSILNRFHALIYNYCYQAMG